MGDLKRLKDQRDDLARRAADREQRLATRLRTMRRTARERYSIAALVVAGVALGIALEQYVRMKAKAPRRPRPTRSRPTPSKVARAPLIPLLQFLVTALLAPRSSRRPKAAPAGPADVVVVQSDRSNPRATHSSAFDGNGLTRH